MAAVTYFHTVGSYAP